MFEVARWLTSIALVVSTLPLYFFLLRQVRVTEAKDRSHDWSGVVGGFGLGTCMCWTATALCGQTNWPMLLTFAPGVFIWPVLLLQIREQSPPPSKVMLAQMATGLFLLAMIGMGHSAWGDSWAGFLRIAGTVLGCLSTVGGFAQILKNHRVLSASGELELEFGAIRVAVVSYAIGCAYAALHFNWWFLGQEVLGLLVWGVVDLQCRGARRIFAYLARIPVPKVPPAAVVSEAMHVEA